MLTPSTYVVLQPLLQFDGVEDETRHPVQQASLLVETENLYALYTLTLHVS